MIKDLKKILKNLLIKNLFKLIKKIEIKIEKL